VSEKNIDVELRTSLLGCEGAVIVEITPADAVALFEKISAEIKRLRAENSTLTAERDEARDEVSLLRSTVTDRNIEIERLRTLLKEKESE
jgi:multidrug resistance efflux pump